MSGADESEAEVDQSAHCYQAVYPHLSLEERQARRRQYWINTFDKEHKEGVAFHTANIPACAKAMEECERRMEEEGDWCAILEMGISKEQAEQDFRNWEEDWLRRANAKGNELNAKENQEMEAAKAWMTERIEIEKKERERLEREEAFAAAETAEDLKALGVE